MPDTHPIDAAFASCSKTHRGALLPYVTAGFPDLDTTADLLRAIAAAGATAIEIGFPYSDSIADGPVIQSSFHAALARGLRIADVFAMLADCADDVPIPRLAMVTYSIVNRIGPGEFVNRCHKAGVSGIIVPDLPLEESASLTALADAAGVKLVMLVAPTTSPQRRRQIAAASRGFVYYQSTAGITGERTRLPDGLAAAVAELRRETTLPVCVGFGVSSDDHVREVCRIADGAIVGSAIVRRIADAHSKDASRAEIVRTVSRFVTELMAGTVRD